MSTFVVVFVCPFCGNEFAEENNVECCGEVGHGCWAVWRNDELVLMDLEFEADTDLQPTEQLKMEA
jgi:hypothetical protein